MEPKLKPPEAVFKDSKATLEQVLNVTCAIAGEPVELTPEEIELLNKYGADYLKEYYELYRNRTVEDDLQKRIQRNNEGKV